MHYTDTIGASAEVGISSAAAEEYVQHTLELDISSASSAYRITEEPSRTVIGLSKKVSADDFLARHSKKKTDLFDASKRPATKYIVDTNLIKRCLLSSQAVQESLYYCIEVSRRTSPAILIALPPSISQVSSSRS